ncbi:MAG: SGNH/GDSL hydrolase family protein [Cyclobacteriaceae bacterium]|nr:SGNH/GDSL hydrolase family protein [Cyclobacteriaceae bacterium SS2]
MSKVLIIGTFILLFICGFTNPTDSNDTDFQERGGLNNLFTRLKSQDTVRVAYLGGSITAQPGWRVYSREWLDQQFSETEVVEIHAAIGGTGSPFGAFRLQDHVLRHKPDLVFVEFAVNDSNTDPETITQSMEGIVRQIWEQDPKTDICFVYTIKSDFIEIYESGNLPVSVETMEKIADHYQIPTINFGPEVLRRVNAGKLLFKGDEAAKDTIEVFSPDNVHPYTDSGHKVYHEVFVKAFSQFNSGKTSKLKKHKVKKPLHSTPLVHAKMIDWEALNNQGKLDPVRTDGHAQFDKFTRFFESVGEGQPDDLITFSFKGRAFGFYDVIGPGSGSLIVSVDGEEQVYPRFDPYCTYWRISYKTIGGLSDTLHKVTIRVSDQLLDKEGILAKRNNPLEPIENYKDHNWYLARLLLDGELVD